MRYVRSFEDREGRSPPQRLPATLRGIRTALRRREGFRYRIKRDRDDSWSHWRGLPMTMVRLALVLSRTKLGQAVRVESRRHTGILRITRAETTPRAPAPSGAQGFWDPKIIEIYEVAFGAPQFKGKIEFWGAYNCRKMRGSSAWSMHSSWPPVLAIDIGVDSKATGDALASYIRTRVSGDVRLVWWTTAHFDHHHWQIGPNRSGTPSCAR